MTEKRFRYNVNKNSIEYDGKHFAYCNGEQTKIARKLNELNDENQELQMRYDAQSELYSQLNSNRNNLYEENKELKRKLYGRNVAKQRRKEYDDFWNEKIKNSVILND